MIQSGIYFDSKANESRPYCVDTSRNQSYSILPNTCGIYAFSGRSKPIESERVMYIGESVTMASRVKDHFREIGNGRHSNTIVQNTVTKHGEFDYTLFVLEWCNRENIAEREQAWLDFYNDQYPGALMNIETKVGFPHLNRTLSREGRESIAKSRRDSKTTKETKAKISKSLIGNKRRLGVKHSEEALAKMSAAHKGKKLSPLHTEQIIKGNQWRMKTYSLIDPKGNLITFTGLARFCRENNLSCENICSLLKGRNKHCKGWTLAETAN